MQLEIFSTVLAALATAIGGYLTTVLAAKANRSKELDKKTLEEVLAATRAQAEEIQAQLAKTLVEKLPEGSSPREIKEALRGQVPITGDVIINQITKGSGDFIQELVNGYHQQALSQARIQFWFSVIAATVGFGYILWSANKVPIEQISGVLKILPGVVIDAVAVLFFRQAEQTRQRATELYDRLRADSQMAASQKLLQTIEDVRIRSAAQAQIALHMAGLKPREIDIGSLLGAGVAGDASPGT